MEPDLSARVQDLEAQVQELQQQLRSAYQEMHARLKNTFQVSAALLDMAVMERPQAPAEDVLPTVRQQLTILALVQDLRMRKEADLERIRLQVLLEEMGRLLQRSPGGAWRLEVTGDDFWLNGTQATALGMVLREWHEMAAPHPGAPLSMIVSSGSEEVILTVSSLARSGASDGTGDTGALLMDTLVRHDLKGEVSYEQEPEGSWRARLRLRRDLFSTSSE